MQKAIDVRYSKIDGALSVEELNGWLGQGWTVVATESAIGGDLLVIIEAPHLKDITNG
jgi:hypothetical protein